MTTRTGFALSLAAMLALALSPAVAAAPDRAAEPPPATFDTPAPTTDGDAVASPGPSRTPRPTPPPEPQVSVFPLVPARNALSVGYSGGSVLRQAPLLVAELAGYFDDVGLEGVTIVRTPDVLADVLSGDLDFAVVSKTEAAVAAENDPTFRAIAGYRNYVDGEYGGDVLAAAPGLVADEPATVLAFLYAYLRASQDLSDTDSAAAALALIEATDLAVSEELVSGWDEAVSAFAPFDGGFGSLEDQGGLGELTTYLTAADGTTPDLDAFIAGHTLNIAQTWSGLDANPASTLVGPPGITDLVVGVPASAGAAGPIEAAIEAGYFEDAGFTSVEVLDVEQPLLGVLQGQLDLGVIDAVDAADGATQGLPLAALAGHRNHGTDGSYGGDLVTASEDLLGEEGSTVSAFLIAYLRGLADLTDDATLAPHDGGFGDREQGGGLAELEAYLRGALGGAADPTDLVRAGPLEYAQAWWGLPANPTTSEEAE